MEHFFIISNSDRDMGQEKAKSIAKYLEQNGRTCSICTVDRFGGLSDEELGMLEEMPADTQCAIILGGDGTIIQVAGELAKKCVPLMGVNMGRLGFLAETDIDDVYPVLDKVMSDENYIEERMMLCGCPEINGEAGSETLALNDIVITRYGALRVIDYDVYVNGRLLTTINGDGIVVSTPTGSTGYSMSAGGPIVEPGARVILITPISAHKLNSRPIVLAPDDVVEIKIASDKYNDMSMVRATFDGGISYELGKGDSVLIKRADEVTRFIKVSKENFLKVMSRKLSS